MSKTISQLLAVLAILLWITLAGFSPNAQAQANLESPSADAFQESGVSLIRGWVCQASRVEISLDGGPLRSTAYGTDRSDTESVCGDRNNGFGLTVNWNGIGDGMHNLRAFADGVEFANVNFVVTTLGGNFLTGLQGEYTLRNFPSPGNSPKVRWSQPHQNFVFVSTITIPENPNPPHNPRATLESPTQGSFESGVSLIRGWVCDASRVEVSIDGGRRVLQVAYGTDRSDTEGVCGDRNNGFGLTFNWNGIGSGVHTLQAFADGVEFAHVNFAVTTLGGNFLTGLSSKQILSDFPSAGKTTTLDWSEPHQNFIITRTTSTDPKLLILSAITDRLNRFGVVGVGTASTSKDTLGVAVTKDSTGQATQVNGVTWTDPSQSASADILLASNGLPATYRDSAGVEARFNSFTDTTTTVSFVDRNGNVQAGPVTVPIDASLLQRLQASIRQAFQGASSNAQKRLTVATKRQVQADSSALGFSLTPLWVNLQWRGGAAAGETLCAVQTAAAQANVRNLAAPLACRSNLIVALLERVKAARQTQADTQADTAADAVDPEAQAVLGFSEDIVEAPCATTADSAACLAPAAAELQKREETTEPPIPPSSPGSTIPSVPSNVNASDGTFADQVQITWSAVAEATSYQVYREGTLIGSPTSVQFDDTTATPGTPYSYAVKACNSAGCSGFSSPDSGFAQAQQTTHLVTPSAGANGSISPATAQTVVHGATTSFTITPATGYSASVGGTCDGALSGTTYTTNPITADCTVSASFVPPEGYLVTATAGPNGTISPPSQTVNAGATASFTVTPTAGYTASVTGCGGSLSGATYTTGPITVDCTVSATFLQGQSGEVRINLVWANEADLDLHVTDPCGNEIYFGQPSAACQGFTGTLDVDANAGTVVPNPAENIVWVSNAPSGSYQVEVCYFGSNGSVGASAYQVVIQAGSSTQTLTGSITEDSSCQKIATFSFGG